MTGKSMVHCHESTQARAHGVLGKERLLKEGSHDSGESIDGTVFGW